MLAMAAAADIEVQGRFWKTYTIYFTRYETHMIATAGWGAGYAVFKSAIR